MSIPSWEIIIDKLDDFEIKRGVTSFVNPYSMLMLKDNEYLATEVDYWYADGISLVKLIKLLFKKDNYRYSFDDTSVAPLVLGNVTAKKQKLAVVGTEPGVIERSVKAIESKYAVKVDYYRDGYMKSEAETMQTIQQLIDKKIEVVICGMGTPRQEEFLVKLKKAGWDGYGYTCGGYLHQIANDGDNYYPEFFNRFNIRWIYRIWDEPKLFSRYLSKYPLFFFEIIILAAKKNKRVF